MIAADADRYPVSAQCEILGVARSTYHSMRSRGAAPGALVERRGETRAVSGPMANPFGRASPKTTTRARDGHPSKASLPISLTLPGSEIVFRDPQPRKAPSPIFFTPSGMVTDFRAEHS